MNAPNPKNMYYALMVQDVDGGTVEYAKDEFSSYGREELERLQDKQLSGQLSWIAACEKYESVCKRLGLGAKNNEQEDETSGAVLGEKGVDTDDSVCSMCGGTGRIAGPDRLSDSVNLLSEREVLFSKEIYRHVKLCVGLVDSKWCTWFVRFSQNLELHPHPNMVAALDVYNHQINQFRLHGIIRGLG